MPETTAVPVPAGPRLWWRVVVVVAASVAGALGAVGCVLAWLLMGSLGTGVEPWEPVAYPAGVVVSLLVPVLVARRLLGDRPRTVRGVPALPVVVAVVTVTVLVTVLGATG